MRLWWNWGVGFHVREFFVNFARFAKSSYARKNLWKCTVSWQKLFTTWSMKLDMLHFHLFGSDRQTKIFKKKIGLYRSYNYIQSCAWKCDLILCVFLKLLGIRIYKLLVKNDAAKNAMSLSLTLKTASVSRMRQPKRVIIFIFSIWQLNDILLIIFQASNVFFIFYFYGSCIG